MRDLRIVIFLAVLLTAASFAAAVPAQPSVVTVNGRQLIVQERLPSGNLASAAPYIIKGMNWSPATAAPAAGPNPLSPSTTTQYGFFFDWPGRNPQGHDIMAYWLREEIQARAAADIPLLAQMNVNTVRLYSDLGTDPAVYTQILDSLYTHGIMVILTVVASKADIDSGRFLSTVQLCKNHPAILMWNIGNEWNFNTLYGYADATTAMNAVHQAAAQIKAIDPNHPVTSILGDKWALSTTCGPDVVNSDIPSIVTGAPNVDLWGINVYRGSSFGNLFQQWQQASSKPFYVSEYGTDSFETSANGYTRLNPDPCAGDSRVQVSSGSPNPSMQASFDTGLWNEIVQHLSAFNPAHTAAGGLLFEFNDSHWKVGNFNVGLGGLVNYDGPDGVPGTADDDTSYGSPNGDGFFLGGGQPDAIANEEYFGVVNANRSPKPAYSALQTAFSLIQFPPPPPVISSPALTSGVAGSTFTFQITATNNPISFSATNLPPGISISTSTGLLSGTLNSLGDGAAQIFLVQLSATNAGGTGTAPLQLNVTPYIPYYCPGGTRCSGDTLTGIPAQLICGPDMTYKVCTPSGWQGIGVDCSCLYPPLLTR